MIDERPEPSEGSVRPSGAPDSPTPVRRVSPVTPPDGMSKGGAPRGDPASGQGAAAERYLGCTIDNRYRVESIVGEGGMGVVYQCRHKIIDKRVALKILRADLARDTEVTERFLMEAKAASAIQDEHIISISDFGQLPDGAAYFVMEFLEGTPLAMIAGGGRPMPLPRIVHIALQLSEGLGAAHQLGIVHRDLKPDNVFLIQRGKEPDFVKILDFGIAKVSSSPVGRLTQAGSVFGTPHYMSPEQAAGTPLDHRGDIYSLGVMLYELATGRVPFDAENFVGILSQQLYQDPVPPRAAAPHANIPAAFEAIILKCMEKRPERRYPSMSQLRDDLLKLDSHLLSPGGQQARGAELSDLGTSVDGTALSTDMSLASLRPRRWPMYAAIVAPLLVVAAVFANQLGGTVASESAPADGPSSAGAESGSLDGKLPHAEPELAPGIPAAPSAAPVQVLLGVVPPAAHVYLDGADLGESPVPIEVPSGAAVEVEIRHPGHVTQQLKLDGSQTRVSIELEPEAKAKKKKKKRSRSKRVTKASSRRAAERSTAPRGTRAKRDPIGGDLFVEPWQKP